MFLEKGGGGCSVQYQRNEKCAAEMNALGEAFCVSRNELCRDWETCNVFLRMLHIGKYAEFDPNIWFGHYTHDKCSSTCCKYSIMFTRWVSVVEFHDQALSIGKVFGQESTVVKWNYQILCLHLVTVRQKVPILDFQSEFSMSKIIRIFLKKISLKNINLSAPFL